MKYIPILFSTAMVQAILYGSKTQTRRIIKPQPNFDSAWKNKGGFELPHIDVSFDLLGLSIDDNCAFKGVGCCVPNVKVKVHKGDVFWVRETFVKINISNEFGGGSTEFAYKASFENAEKKYGKIKNPMGKRFIDSWKWKPSIFMPKEACRLFLEVTNVRVERLQDISEEDSVKEGIISIGKINRVPVYIDYRKSATKSIGPKESFFSLWESINGKESLESNPFVWVYDFKVIERPEK